MQLLLTISSVALLASAAVHTPDDQLPLRAEPLTIGNIPLLGFGTWNLKEANTSEAVAWAIEVGYRHIDCASAYGNQDEVGIGIKLGLSKTGLRREDLWITSKLWNDHHGSPTLVEQAISQTLSELGLEYLDLWHMHWPVTAKMFGNDIEYLDTWGAMTWAKEQGLVRHLGVSNFAPDQLRDLLNHTHSPPDVHQMELHPYLQQNDWLDFHKKHNIHVTAYSPLAGTNPTYQPGDPPHLLKNKVVKKIANKRGCTPAQVVLRWGIERGTSVIPKSIHKDYISQNFLATECGLKTSDLKKLDKLDKYHHRFNNPAKNWGVELYKDLEDSEGKHKLHS